MTVIPCAYFRLVSAPFFENLLLFLPAAFEVLFFFFFFIASNTHTENKQKLHRINKVIKRKKKKK